jgi:hypothetical protein
MYLVTLCCAALVGLRRSTNSPQVPAYTCKYNNKVEMLAMGKHPSLVGFCINDEEKEF